MYTKEEEIKTIYDLLANYMSYQRQAILFFESGNWRNYQRNDVVNKYQDNLKKSRKIVNMLDKLLIYFFQGYSMKQLGAGGIAERRAQEGARIFSDIKKSSEYIDLMSEIAHNTYFNNAEKKLSDIVLPEEQISNHLANIFKNGMITKEELILYKNYFTYLVKDPEYIELVSENKESVDGVSK